VNLSVGGPLSDALVNVTLDLRLPSQLPSSTALALIPNYVGWVKPVTCPLKFLITVARKTPLRKPLHAKEIISTKPRPKIVYDFFSLEYCFIVYCVWPYTIFILSLSILFSVCCYLLWPL